MAGSQYAKYVLRQTAPAKAAPAMPVVLDGLKNWAGVHHRMEWQHITKPNVLVNEPHSHSFDEFLCFFGSDPGNAFDLGCEVELSMGTEGEKQIITSGTIVCIPKGMVHGPLKFKKVKKPMLFSIIYLSPKYTRKSVPRK